MSEKSEDDRLSESAIFNDAATLNQKTARIKQWVKNRLQELEDQNERLRAQNLRCNAQLALLKSCADRTKAWRASLIFSHSVTGALPTIRDFMECNRTSEDSGLTSDEHTSIDRRQYERKLMSQSTNSAVKVTPHSPRACRRTVRTRTRSTSRGDQVDQTQSSTTESSPAEENSKPVPTPRKSKIQFSTPIHLPLIDRDSLEPYDDGCADDGDDEIFDEIEDDDLVDQIDDRSILELTDSMCELESTRLHSSGDYVNLAELCQLRSFNTNCTYSKVERPPKPPVPPKHQHIVPWEQKLHQLAEKCLNRQSDESTGRDSIFPPSTSSGRSSSSARTTTSERSSSINNCIALRKSPAVAAQLSRHVSNISTMKTKSKEASDITCRRNTSNEYAPRLTNDSPMPFQYVNHGSPAKHLPLNRSSPVAYATATLFEMNDECPSSSDGDYAFPPDVEERLDEAVSTTVIEKAGYLIAVTDSRFKSLKRRYVKLKNGQLLFYKTQKEETRKEDPLMKMSITDIKSVTRVMDSSVSHGFQIITNSARYQYTTDTSTNTDDWIRVLNVACRNASINEFEESSPASTDTTVKGWLTKVKCGHSKRYFATLAPPKLLFFKALGAKIPSAQLFVKGAHVSEVSRSSDESSGSSDDLQADSVESGEQRRRRQPNVADRNYSVLIQLTNAEPIYLCFEGREERDKWLYFLRLASKDGELYGTPLEVLVQRLLAVNGRPDTDLWHDMLLTICEENPKQPLTSMPDEAIKKEALALDRGAYLFTAVLMRATGVQYHIDLAQNTLQTAMQSDELKNELMAQLIKLTNGSMPYGLQAWKLLALAVSLFVPTQYAILWLLKKHLERWICLGGDESNMAGYCQRSLQRCLKNGNRKEAPSKLEVTSLLTRNPCITQMPHSISVQLPSGDYQVVEFDGSSLVGECLSTLSSRIGIRSAPLSGYALYSDDPAQSDDDVIVLNNKHKICDCLSQWERLLKDSRCGRVPDDRAIRIQLRLRHYWSHMTNTETAIERLFLAYRMADELRTGHLPISGELAEELCALFAQLHLGDCANELSNDRFEQIVAVFYPMRLLEITCKRSLRANLQSRWSSLQGLSGSDCIRIILGVLRKWRFFGTQIYEAGMKLKNDQKIVIGVNDAGVHLLSIYQLELIKSYPYQQLVSFGGYHEDFMLTVKREPSSLSTPDEPTKERLTFSMSRHSIAQLTAHIADFIKCRKLVWHASHQRSSCVPSPPQHTLPGTPRKAPPSATHSSSMLT